MQQDDKTPAHAAQFLEHVPLPREPRDIRDITPAPPRLFSTRHYPPPEQFEVWKTRMASLVDVAPPEGHSPAHGFLVEYLTCNMADVVFTSGRFAAQSFARVIKPSHGAPVDIWWLYRVRSGEARFETAERRIHAMPGAMFLISLDEDFRGTITDYDGLVLGLPRRSFADMADQLDGICNILLEGNLIELLADYLDRLEARITLMSSEELRQAGRATAQMIAACIQLSSDRLERARGAVEPVLFERARLYIEAHLADFDLTPDRIAQQLRISRSALYRAFESVGGVAGYILRKRLRAAHAELVTSADRQVQEIAYRHGFKLASDFARAFRREFGVSPREMRERMRRRSTTG
ncbi:helix-turn-helix transcriptional regulator [Bradyrhizobium brasilense]|uniref:AraC family transcriptional regulator n=1 Tax=Bradyrhizobium brasilense TaxID=1419277 RepID=UPI002877F8C6|nr:helix-turn-helix transcriptional regulator [Bradyrhizobium brasilense]MCP3416446.1 helix-turn-helix transcriptional regulator [Bradyrhizobium brasilense]